MFEGMYRVTSSLLIEEKRHATTARNLAGVTVPGYRREFLISGAFGSVLGDSINNDGSGVQARAEIDWSQGDIRRTGRALDFAISGKGFFAVEVDGGQEVYTRNGAFRVDAERQLVTQSGNVVLDDRLRPIIFNPADNIQTVSVRRDGSIYVRGDGGPRLVARLRLVEIADMQVLERLSASYYAVAPENERLVEDAADSVVLNGSLEHANVSAIEEMAQMVQSLREFEANQNLIRSSDDILRKHIQAI